MRVEPISPADDKREWAEDIKYRIKKMNDDTDFERSLENAKREINKQKAEAQERIREATKKGVVDLCVIRNRNNIRVSDNWISSL